MNDIHEFSGTNSERKLPIEFKTPHEAHMAFFAALERVNTLDNTFLPQPNNLEKAKIVGFGNRAADYFYGNGPFDSDQIVVWNDETGKKRIALQQPPIKGREELRERIISRGEQAGEVLFGKNVKKIIFQ